MDTIFNNLKDPSWWFSTVIIAIIASVIAGFVKDRVEKWLATIFASLRQTQMKHEENRAKIIDTLLNDNVYLGFALFRTLLTAIAFTYFLIQYYFSIGDSSGSHSHRLLTDAGNLDWSEIKNILHSLLGSLTAFIGYIMSRRASIMLDASREYRKRNNLPKFP